MRLTVLGCSPASTNPGGASSSYLIEEGSTKVLVDCGNGSLGVLLQHTALEDVTSIVISHMHFDHMLDLIPYRYALAFARDTRARNAQDEIVQRPTLYLPPEGHAMLLQITHVQDPGNGFFSDYFDVREYDPASSLTVGPMTLAFVAVKHRPHTYAIRVTAGDHTLAYSADTGVCPGIYEAARDADVFLCECANAAGSDFALHLTAAQAGSIAQDAGAQRLLLTHRWYRTGLEEALTEAATTYHGPIEMASQGITWEI